MKIDTCRIKSNLASDVYIKASVIPNIALKEQANELFRGIRQVLESEGAHILRKRIFGNEADVQSVRPIRTDFHHSYNDLFFEMGVRVAFTKAN